VIDMHFRKKNTHALKCIKNFGIWTLAQKMMSFRFLENVFVLQG